MKKVSDANLSQILENNNIPKGQTDVINEIFKAFKLTNPKTESIVKIGYYFACYFK